ncbi:MAG TPA: hypothetical protein VG206_03310 [Terriglobia bacterium]|nr:hypothetical protein [Terriglobia bacterium]
MALAQCLPRTNDCRRGLLRRQIFNDGPTILRALLNLLDQYLHGFSLTGRKASRRDYDSFGEVQRVSSGSLALRHCGSNALSMDFQMGNARQSGANQAVLQELAPIHLPKRFLLKSPALRGTLKAGGFSRHGIVALPVPTDEQFRLFLEAFQTHAHTSSFVSVGGHCPCGKVYADTPLAHFSCYIIPLFPVCWKSHHPLCSSRRLKDEG